MTFHVNRRQALALGAGAVAVATWPAAALAKNDQEELIKKFTAGKEAIKGKVKLDLPTIAENGNTVPMTVSVESPMTAESNTRIRLAETQDVTALAKMSDGSFYMASQEVKVTIGGCGG